MAFDLSAVLAGVAPADNGKKQIEYIRADLMDSDPGNFYRLDGIDELAANIAMCGLQQPIVVRQNPDKPGRYMIVSGHRRMEALRRLAADDPDKWTDVPCIVDRDEASPALRQLRLIYANAGTRVMTSPELQEQAAQVESLLYQLKKEGYDFPGRMRDHVAQAVGVSKTKIARLAAIKNNLHEPWAEYYRSGKLPESHAYTLSGFPLDAQTALAKAYSCNDVARYSYLMDALKQDFRAIRHIKCDDGGKCSNVGNMIDRRAKKRDMTNPCSHCCKSCADLPICRYSCLKCEQEKTAAIDAAKKRKETADAAKAQQEEREKAEKLQKLETVKAAYARVKRLREAAGVSVEDYVTTAISYANFYTTEKFAKQENGEEIDPYTHMPFGCMVTSDDIERLFAAADLLGCSIDELLGHEISVPTRVASSCAWRTDNPDRDGLYVTIVKFDACDYAVAEILRWRSVTCEWLDNMGESYAGTDFYVAMWAELPEKEAAHGKD